MEALIDWLVKAVDAVGGWMGFSAILGGVIDMIVRLIPSVNPRSLLLSISRLFKAVAGLAEKLSQFLDSLGLQVLKEAPAAPKKK